MRKKIRIRPGAISVWKEYGWFNQTLAKLGLRKLPYNRIQIYARDIDIVFVNPSSDNILAYYIIEPKQKYNNNERIKLLELLHDINIDWAYPIDYLSILNIVRPETFDLSTVTLGTIRENKYYKQVYEYRITEDIQGIK
jgi:hypothetical protein